LDKFARLLALCADLGVETRPGQVDGVRIVPLFSWYSAHFDVCGEGDEAALASWGDFRFCRWPDHVESPDEHFAESNVPLGPSQLPTISFSHFLPRRELLPDVEHLRFKGLPKVAGSLFLEPQIRALGATTHVFGHSHIPCDKVLQGVRYVQQPLAYPKERGQRQGVLKQLV